ncbi:PucR family transcriptional regulator [Nocardia asteroides]|uniref:PucR family transcriptional regulator n=1 Tax=Nocardia asteroides TaxID=1824 RepID=UPI001E4C8826|nr:helix-turn-helix domain-containing protein [Nocardia asteroides]UGT53619.1 helix-turn-helix domain-containing protein [Nocardia asteroides]
MVQRALPGLAGLAERTVATSVAQVPVYGQLSAELTERELRATATTHFTTFTRLAQTGEEPTAADLVPVTSSARRRAEEGIALPDMLDAYLFGMRTVFDAVTDGTTAEDLGDVLTFTKNLLAYLHRATVAITTAHLDTDEAATAAARAARAELATSLLHTGTAAEELAGRAGIAPAQDYTVVEFAVHTPHAIPANPGELASARRRDEQLRRLIAAWTNGQGLHHFDGHHGTVLLPTGSRYPAPAPEDLITALGEAFALPITAATTTASLPELPARAELARDVLSLARGLRRPPGLYRLEDLLVEYQLTRPGPARDALEAQIAPVFAHPHLVETLYAHLHHGIDRPAAAAALHIHANTYTYRLQRIHELTGLDATDTAEARQLAAATLSYTLTHSTIPMKPEFQQDDSGPYPQAAQS